MSTINYKVGDTYPNLKSTVKWAGSLKTDTITGVLVANGITTGPFTGAVVMTSSDSENATESTWSWSYDVGSDDTIEGSYELCVQVTHDSGEVENIVPTNNMIKVGSC